MALTGDPARVKPEDLDGAALHASFTANYEAPVLLARACAERMADKGTQGRDRARSRACRASTRSRAAWPTRARRPRSCTRPASWPRSTAAPPDIRVNVVAPGATIAGMARASIDSGKYDPYVERGVIPRFGRPEDVAKVVRLLLEPDSYLTGQVITVDGGLTLRRDRLG